MVGGFVSETYVSRASAQPLKEGKSRTPTDRPPIASSASRAQKRQPPPASAEGGFRLKKAGEAIRTPDIHVGNVTLYH
jgi:hypothetical protein